MKQVLLKALSLAMVFTLMFSICSVTVSATVTSGQSAADNSTDKETFDYVSLGASNVNGYGMYGYVPTDAYPTPLEKANQNVYGYKSDTPGSYPVLIKEALSDSYNVNLHQMAISSMRAEEILFLLDENAVADKYTQWRFYDESEPRVDYDNNWFVAAGYQEWELAGGQGAKPSHSEALAILRQAYKNAITNAELITVDVGMNNFGVYISHQIGSKSESNPDGAYGNDLNKLDPEIAEKYAIGKEYVLGLIDKYMGDSELPVEQLEDIADTLAYALVGYCLSFDAILDKIYEWNPDVNVVVVSIQNLMEGLDTEVMGIDGTVPFGEIFGAVVNAANTYTAVISKHAGSYNYANVTESGHIELFADEALKYDGNPENIGRDMRDCFDVYDNNMYLQTRIQQIYAIMMSERGLVWMQDYQKIIYNPNAGVEEGIIPFYNGYHYDKPFMGIQVHPVMMADGRTPLKAFLNADRSVITDPTLLWAYDFYYGMLDVAYDVMTEIMREGAKITTIDMQSLDGHGDAKHVLLKVYSETVYDAINAYVADQSYNFDINEAYPEGIFNYVAEEYGFDIEFLNTVVALAVRGNYGNSFFAHPNGEGQKQIAECVLNAYYNDITGAEVVRDNLEQYFDSLLTLLGDNFDAIYAFAYEKLKNAGCIEVAINKLNDVKAIVDSLYNDFASVELEGDNEILAGYLAEELWNTSVTISQFCALLESDNSADFEANLPEVLDTLKAHRSTLEAICRQLYDADDADGIVSAVLGIIDSLNEHLFEMFSLVDIDVRLDSVFLSIGGAGSVADNEHYASLVGDYYGITSQILNDADIRMVDLLAILDSSYASDEYGLALLQNINKQAYLDAIMEADIISLDMGAEEITSFVVNQVMGYVYENYGDKINGLISGSGDFNYSLGEHTSYSMNWESLVSKEQKDAVADAVIKALEELGIPSEIEITEGFCVDVFSLAAYTVECCLYATVNYVYYYGRTIDAIHEINPDAEVIILGSFNVLDGFEISIDGYSINLDVLTNAMASVMDIFTLTYSYNNDKTNYIYIGGVETVAEEDGVVGLLDFIRFEESEGGAYNICFNVSALDASAAGHKYIAEQILKAIDSDIPCHHTFDGCTDTDCNDCGFIREAGEHAFSDCTDTTCYKCDYVREAGTHVYDGCLDSDCNVCAQTRTPAHTYAFECSEKCELCGYTRTASHNFGEWTQTIEPTRNEAGESTRVCSVCGKTENREIAPYAKLSTGAAVGITIGSVVVSGAGGFSVFWFVVKKKSLTDLIAAIKTAEK